MTESLGMTAICRRAAEKRKPEVMVWGLVFAATSEMEALRIAYAYRNNPHGVKVERRPGFELFGVTVWNAKAKAMGCDV